MRMQRIVVATAITGLVPACVGENQAEPRGRAELATGTFKKGGDDRNGDYNAAADWRPKTTANLLRPPRLAARRIPKELFAP